MSASAALSDLARINIDGVDAVIENLLLAKNRVAECRSAARVARERAQELEQVTREQEAEMVLEIAFEVGPNGKPRFSNENLREAELTRRKSCDAEWQRIKASCQEAKREQQRKEDDLATALDEFRTWQIIAKLKTAEYSAE